MATANANSDDVSLYNVIGSTLSGGINYPVPGGGRILPRSVSFSPDGTLLATANQISDDVTLFIVDCSSTDGTTDGTDGTTTVNSVSRLQSIVSYIQIVKSMLENYPSEDSKIQ